MILPREQWLPFQHLRKYATGTPYIDLNIILLPREHDLGGAVVSCRDVACHLRVLDTGETEVANFEIAVLVDEDVARFEVTVDDAGGVDVFQATLEELARLDCCAGKTWCLAY